MRFLSVIRYIHRNPVKAGLVEQPAEYFWSSMKDYVENRMDLVPVDKEIAYSFFKVDFRQRFLEHHAEDAAAPMIEKVRGVSYYGDERFAVEFKSRIERRRKERKLSRRFAIEALECAVESALGMRVAEIIRDRRHDMTRWKERIVFLALERCGMNYREMSDRWSVQQSRLTKMGSRYDKEADRAERHGLADLAAEVVTGSPLRVPG